MPSHRRKRINRRRQMTNTAAPLLVVPTALVRLLDFTIVGTAPVTEHTNIGTGGAIYDLDLIVGTDANLTPTTFNGRTVIVSSGSVGMEVTTA